MSRIKQGCQRNKVILTLNNSELDALEDVVDNHFWPNEPEGKKHILQQIQNARREALQWMANMGVDNVNVNQMISIVVVCVTNGRGNNGY